MTTKIELFGNWLLFERGSASLQIQSFKCDINSEELSNIGDCIISELGKVKDTNHIIGFLSDESFYPITLVYTSPELTILKSDTVRSVPLFYTLKNNRAYISDRNNPQNGYVLDEGSIIEMIEIGYVSCEHTVYKDTFGMQAAEIIIIKGEGVKKERFFKYDVGQSAADTNRLSVKEYAVELDCIFNEIFQEIIESIPNKGRIVVPLSGGHDSRTVVNYLYKLGFKRVLCFSYGIPANIQSEISRQVAEALGYEWHFIEYTDEKWGKLHENRDVDDFIRYAFNGVSTPHLQDFLAVYELKKNGVLKPDDVFIPGHGLDILSVSIEYSQDKTDIVKEAVVHFSRSKKNHIDKNEILYKRYAKIFEDAGVSEDCFLEYLFWQERAAKFTVNSLRVYAFYGYVARLPFWDTRLINFWLMVGRELKQSKALRFEMEDKYLLTKQLREIPYASDKNPNKKMKKSIKDYIPDFLTILYLRISKRKVPQSEGLNLIYSSKAKSVSELLGPTDKWPPRILNSINSDLKRYPFQINHHFLTRLYTINKLLNN